MTKLRSGQGNSDAATTPLPLPTKVIPLCRLVRQHKNMYTKKGIKNNKPDKVSDKMQLYTRHDTSGLKKYLLELDQHWSTGFLGNN